MRSVGAKRPETHLPAPPERPIARPSCPKTDAKPGAGAAAAPRHAILRLLATGQSELDENGELCVLQGRLYLASLAGNPVPTEKKYLWKWVLYPETGQSRIFEFFTSSLEVGKRGGRACWEGGARPGAGVCGWLAGSGRFA
jgi:hypothetical protein